MKWLKVIILSSCLMLSFAQIGYATNGTKQTEVSDKVDSMVKASDQALSLVRQEDYASAKRMLDAFATRIKDIGYDQFHLSMTDLRVLTTSFEKAYQSVTSTTKPHEDIVANVTAFRLVVDAVASPSSNLWQATEDSVMAPLNRMKQAVNADDRAGYERQFNLFIKKYEMVSPALTLAIDETVIEKTNSLINFLKNNNLSLSENSKAVVTLEREVYRVYHPSERQNDPSILIAIGSIGGIVVATLIYVGWRKYRGEKKVRKVKQRSKRL